MKIKFLRSPTLTFQLLFVASLIILISSTPYILSNKIIIIYWEITTLNASPLIFPVILDPVGILFRAVVIFISANVLMFSNTYIAGDPFISRFILLVIAFILSINMLIFFPHLITLLLGWDGLGLISFILVIYYQNAKSLAAGIITALTNRIGDAFLLIAIAYAINQNHWIITDMWSSPINSILCLSILVAAITKSAQVPFSRWLPAAIAAPTPVSSLVHSSTLVTAGVFLLIRFYPALHSIKWFNTSLLITARLTIIIAGIRAIVETDLKKIIALSTLRQLGVIITSLGLGYVSLTLFHLLTHALFKALLFLCAGNVIHTHLHGQDLRIVGNLSRQLPTTISCILIANLSLCGIPFLAGFYSKDTILELAIWNPVNIIIISLLFVATALTAIYSSRFIYYLIVAPNYHPPLININEEDDKSTAPIILLTLGAIIAGAWIFWVLFPFSSSPQLPAQIKLFTLLIVLLVRAFTLGQLIPKFASTNTLANSPLLNYTHALIWFLSPISSQLALKPAITLGHHFLKTIDQAWVEINISQSSNIISITFSNKMQILQKNRVNSYILLGVLTLPPLLIMISLSVK